jgi:bifunctional non-homologous end joining protein LigD
VPERGEDLYAAVAELGLEGIVGKRIDSPYRAGYSADWVKVRVDQTADFAVLGFEPVPRSRSGLRCLHLGVRDGAGWAYAGSVGTGFSSQESAEIRERLEPSRRPQSVLPGKAPGDRSVVWVEPEIVCEVRFKEWTRGGHLRQPVFLRLRDDKTVEECQAPHAEPHEPVEEAEADLPGETAPASPALTNLDKVFWPDEGYTKGDLIEHYRAVAPWLLPYLKDRPLVLDRYPNGITGKSFFQKNAPELAPSWLRTISIGSIDYFLCDTEEALLYLANLGTIPLHIWSSRVDSLDRPDWCILDLDPKGAPFEHVVRIALEIRSLCDEIELESFVKTSGGSGLHVLLPLGRQFEHDAARQLGELLARVIVERLPEIATTARAIPARRGRVYVDALQNGRGKLLAGPYSVRPRPGATVSTPLDWREVGPRLDVRSFTIRTVPKRLAKRKDDPLLPVLEKVPDLARSLVLLSGLV